MREGKRERERVRENERESKTGRERERENMQHDEQRDGWGEREVIIQLNTEQKRQRSETR